MATRLTVAMITFHIQGFNKLKKA